MVCIICQDTGSEPLHDNKFCSCKYKTHNSCWNDYASSTDKIKCLLCRKEVLIKPVIETIHTPLIQPSAPPYDLSEPQGQQRQQITYQEFVEIISHLEPPNTVITVQSTQPDNSQPNSKKIMKTVIGLGIIFTILIIFVLLIKLL
jgi:hypothetical protein